MFLAGDVCRRWSLSHVDRSMLAHHVIQYSVLQLRCPNCLVFPSSAATKANYFFSCDADHFLYGTRQAGNTSWSFRCDVLQLDNRRYGQPWWHINHLYRSVFEKQCLARNSYISKQCCHNTAHTVTCCFRKRRESLGNILAKRVQPLDSLGVLITGHDTKTWRI